MKRELSKLIDLGGCALGGGGELHTTSFGDGSTSMGALNASCKDSLPDPASDDWIACFKSCAAPGTQCDLKATPPQCEGGKLRINCHGRCEATADGGDPGPASYCAGKCDTDFDLLCCEGGTMKSGCTSDPACLARCTPKATCH